MNIDKASVMEEIWALEDTCKSIDFDLDKGTVHLKGFPFPRGWDPRIGSILFVLPNQYRQVQPLAYMPAEMTYMGTRPMIMLRCKKLPAGYDPQAWSKHCIHKLHNWNANKDTMVTLTRMIVDSLERPNSNDPLRGR